MLRVARRELHRFVARLYTIYAMDENGCTAVSGAISVANPPALTVAVSGGQNGILGATCADSEDGFAVLITIGGSGPYTSMQYSADGVNFTLKTCWMI